MVLKSNTISLFFYKKHESTEEYVRFAAGYVASAAGVHAFRRNLCGVCRRGTYVPPQDMWRPPQGYVRFTTGYMASSTGVRAFHRRLCGVRRGGTYFPPQDMWRLKQRYLRSDAMPEFRFRFSKRHFRVII